MKKTVFSTPTVEIYEIKDYDVITTSVMNANGTLENDGYGSITSFDDYGL